MKKIYFLGLLIISIFSACNFNENKDQSLNEKTVVYPISVLATDSLIISQVAKHVYIHTSFLQTESFGNVPCNGMVVVKDGKAFVFDATTSDSSSNVLIKWMKDSLKVKPEALLITHFHEDCLGGAKAFKQANIVSYASNKTLDICKQKGLFVPDNGFDTLQTWPLGTAKIEARYFGPGHTQDNIVAYFDEDAAMFGGCLIKELNANKGYLGDADTLQWSNTISKIIKAYPKVEIVVPGHGAYGDKTLLDYTYKLFAKGDTK